MYFFLYYTYIEIYEYLLFDLYGYIEIILYIDYNNLNWKGNEIISQDVKC